MRYQVGLACVTTLFACGGNGGPIDFDAPPVDSITPDASPIDAGPLPACTGAIYDPCTDTTASADCNGSAAPGAPMCKEFTGAGITVCTQTCGSSGDCPTQDGSATFCNAKGICKPNFANACKPS
jgi:hypothetical protein